MNHLQNRIVLFCGHLQTCHLEFEKYGYIGVAPTKQLKYLYKGKVPDCGIKIFYLLWIVWYHRDDLNVNLLNIKYNLPVGIWNSFRIKFDKHQNIIQIPGIRSHRLIVCVYLIEMRTNFFRNKGGRTNNDISPIITKQTTFSVQLFCSLGQVYNIFKLQSNTLMHFQAQFLKFYIVP